MNQALTVTVNSVEQLSNGRHGCVGKLRSSYESDGVRLLSRENVGLGVEVLAFANVVADNPAVNGGFKVHPVEVRPVGSEVSTTLLSQGDGITLKDEYWARNQNSLTAPPGFLLGAFRRYGVFRQCDAAAPFELVHSRAHRQKSNRSFAVTFCD